MLIGDCCSFFFLLKLQTSLLAYENSAQHYLHHPLFGTVTTGESFFCLFLSVTVLFVTADLINFFARRPLLRSLSHFFFFIQSRRKYVYIYINEFTDRQCSLSFSSCCYIVDAQHMVMK